MSLLTTNEVAEKLGVTLPRVHALIRGGRLPAEKMGRDYFIKEADLALVINRKPGRPPKDPAETTAKLNKAFREAKEAEEASQKKTAKKGSRK